AQPLVLARAGAAPVGARSHAGDERSGRAALSQPALGHGADAAPGADRTGAPPGLRRGQPGGPAQPDRRGAGIAAAVVSGSSAADEAVAPGAGARRARAVS